MPGWCPAPSRRALPLLLQKRVRQRIQRIMLAAPRAESIRESRPREFHPEPLAEPDVVGMELGRAAVRWRVTIPALSVVRWVPISTSVTSPEAPLQSRKVGFPDSGFRLGFPQEAFPRMREAKALARIHPTHSGLPRSSSLKSGLFRFASLTHAKTAKCSELLCLS